MHCDERRLVVADRCDLTELLVDQCSHCRGDELQSETTDRGPWFTAAYPGACSRCGTGFEPGDEIRAGGHGGYLPECCGEDED
jgi:hypothetical protein